MTVVGRIEDVLQPPDRVVIALVLMQAFMDQVGNVEEQLLVINGVRTVVEVDTFDRQRMGDVIGRFIEVGETVAVGGITFCEWQHAGAALQQAGGAMEGKEVRFGIPGSSLFAGSTTTTSTGAVNSFHDSFTAFGGGAKDQLREGLASRPQPLPPVAITLRKSAPSAIIRSAARRTSSGVSAIRPNQWQCPRVVVIGMPQLKMSGPSAAPRRIQSRTF